METEITFLPQVSCIFTSISVNLDQLREGISSLFPLRIDFRRAVQPQQ